MKNHRLQHSCLRDNVTRLRSTWKGVRFGYLCWWQPLKRFCCVRFLFFPFPCLLVAANQPQGSLCVAFFLYSKLFLPPLVFLIPIFGNSPPKMSQEAVGGGLRLSCSLTFPVCRTMTAQRHCRNSLWEGPTSVPHRVHHFHVSGQLVTPSALLLEVMNIFRHMVLPAPHVLNDTPRANTNDELLRRREKNIFWLLAHSQVSAPQG